MERRKAARERLTESINSMGERSATIRVNQINKRKCKKKRRGPAQTLY